MRGYSLAIREGFRNFRRGRTLSFAMIGCIAVAVFALGAFGLLALNISFELKQWENRVELVAFLSHGVKERQAEKVLQEVISIPEVGDARLVSSRESWKELFPDVDVSLDFDEMTLDEVLPISLVIRLRQGKRDLPTIRQVASQIASLDGVDEVKFEEMLLERYMQLRQDLAVLTTGTSIVCMLVFGIITVNIARLGSAARKNEVRTLQMLGASKRFIRRVFTVEGVAQGVSGSAIGIGVLVSTAMILSSRMGGTVKLPVYLFAIAFAVGPLLGLLGSRFLFRSALMIVCAAVLLAAVSANVSAQTGDNLGAEVIQYQEELKRLEAELRESRASAQEVWKQERAIIDELEGIEKGIDALEQEIKTGEKAVVANRLIVEKGKDELARYEAEFSESRRELERWLRLLCNRREPTMVEVIINDIPQSETIRRREIISLLARKEAETLEKTERLRAVVRDQQEGLRKRSELDTLYTEAARLRAQQSIEKKKQRKLLLAKIREQGSIYSAAIKDLEMSARQLQELIETRQAEEQSVFVDSAPFREMKGLLPWPTDGEITVPFGRVKNPDSPTYTRHLGIDISAPTGSEIKAIHDATVAYCDWFRGYGKLVILDHGNGYNSVYSHCSEILVQKGDSVRAGQPIALVGETGSLKGPFLYFEMREHGQPVDPVVWLQRRSINATQPK